MAVSWVKRMISAQLTIDKLTVFGTTLGPPCALLGLPHHQRCQDRLPTAHNGAVLRSGTTQARALVKSLRRTFHQGASRTA